MDVAADTTLLAVPNVSEGRDRGGRSRRSARPSRARPRCGCSRASRTPIPTTIARSSRSPARRAASPTRCSPARARPSTRIDLASHHGLHPHVGAIDVVPIVHLDDARRGAACAEALVVADRLADELGLPVFLYGLLAGGRTRAELRRGGIAAAHRADARRGARRRTSARPSRIRRPGAVLVAARPPLVAFNLELAAPATLEDARRIAAADPRGRPGRPARRPRDRARARPPRRRRAGLDERRGPPRGAPRRRCSTRSAGTPRSPRPSSSGSRPQPRSTAGPTDVAVRNRATIEDALRRISDVSFERNLSGSDRCRPSRSAAVADSTRNAARVRRSWPTGRWRARRVTRRWPACDGRCRRRAACGAVSARTRAPLRDFLSLAPPTRPTRVTVHVRSTLVFPSRASRA